MNPAPEEFDELRKLLVLKRHEHPPSGFFKQYAAEIRPAATASPRHENSNAPPEISCHDSDLEIDGPKNGRSNRA